MIAFDNIVHRYKRDRSAVTAVDGISLEIRAGEFVALKGPSGCGKTTLLMVAGGLLKPSTGGVEIDGKDPYAMAVEERAVFRALMIGFVFQQFHLIPYLSVLDNVMAPMLATGQPLRSRALELVRHFGLDDRIHHTPDQLSTGERQRTALARALLNKPKILLADEPTGNLDRESTDVVLQHLKDFARGGGSVLMVSHDEHAVQFAQRVIQLKKGKLVVDSTTALKETRTV
ncbi:MAG: ABC transporter ATP-binding protein [Verrucomicrobiota bacterium]